MTRERHKRIDPALRADFTGRMRLFRLATAICLPVVAGCAANRAAFAPLPSSASGAATGGPTSADFPGASRPLTVTPENVLTGKVARVNSEGGFVVLTFLPGHMPALAERLALYRKGLRVGEVKITGPQNDDDVVADVLIGDAEVQDEVRNR
jgi:hypothetical protein